MIKNILNFFKKNLYFILLSITVFLSSTIQMPYYIKTGGGLIDASQRFEIENTDNKESIYMAYVSEMKATPFSYLIAKIRKYDITKIEEKTYYNETEEDSFFRSKMLLEEANATAILVAYKAANKEVNVLNNELYVTYIDELANTDLEIGDQILQINNEKIDDKKNLYEIIKNYKSGDRINILVKNNRAYWGVGGYFFCVFTVAAEHISKTEHSYGKADNRNQTFCRKHTTPPSFFKSRRAQTLRRGN